MTKQYNIAPYPYGMFEHSERTDPENRLFFDYEKK